MRVNKRAPTMDVCGWRGGRKEGEMKYPENNRINRWGRRDRSKVLIIRDKILGAEVSMSEIGI